MIAAALSFEQARDIAGGKFGAVDAPCPLCGPDRRSPTNRRRKTLRLWCTDPAFISYHCARCGEQGFRVMLNKTLSALRSADLIGFDRDWVWLT